LDGYAYLHGFAAESRGPLRPDWGHIASIDL